MQKGGKTQPYHSYDNIPHCLLLTTSQSVPFLQPGGHMQHQWRLGTSTHRDKAGGQKTKHNFTTEWYNYIYLEKSTFFKWTFKTFSCVLTVFMSNTDAQRSFHVYAIISGSTGVPTHGFNQLVFHDATVVLMDVALLPVLKETHTRFSANMQHVYNL